MPRLVRNWITGSYPGWAAEVGPPWQKTTRGGGPPGSSTSGLTGAKNSPGTDRPSTVATHGSDGDARSGGTSTAGGSLSRRTAPSTRSTARQAWASVGVDPRTATVRTSTATTSDRPTQGWSTSDTCHPVASGPSSGGDRPTRPSRPPDVRRAAMRPSANSATVCWASTQSGPWYSTPPAAGSEGSRRGTASDGRGPLPDSAPGGSRYGSHQPVRSSTNTRPPSAVQTGWPTDVPGPPATVTGSPTRGGSSPPASGATRTEEASHGMSGWSQVTQASQRPSGDGRGATTKSPSSTTVEDVAEPSTAMATRACVVRDPPARGSPTRSSTDRSQRPSGVTAPSPWRVPAPSSAGAPRRTGTAPGVGSSRNQP